MIHCATKTAKQNSWTLEYLKVPDKVWSGMVTVELVVEQFPVSFTLDTLTMFAEDHQLLL